MKAGSCEYKKGLWTVEEDKILMDYIKVHGKGKWNHIAKVTGLKRCGKSCRLRWINYLSPSVKRDNFSEEEDDLIIRLHKLLGNRWSLIAGRVPGRTDNQVKNHWNTQLSKRLGVKKEKCKISNVSSGFNSESRSLSRVQSTSKYTPNPLTNDGALCQNTTEDGTKSEMELISSTQGVASSFLFFDNYPNLYSPNLMQALDHESLDFVLFDL